MSQEERERDESLSDNDDVAHNEEAEEQPVHSELDDRTRSLLKLIYDLNAMKECLVKMNFDIRMLHKNVPLGHLTQEQINAGYEALKSIEECLKRDDPSEDELMEASSKFYTRIPHDSGKKRPPIISTEEKLKEKITLLEALSAISIAIQKLDQSGENSDEQYRSLQCELQPLDPSSDKYQMIEEYLQTTHASSRHKYTMTIDDIFSVNRKGESDNFRSDLHNRTLLWHGSHLSNWVGILRKGLRVAPPDADVTGCKDLKEKTKSGSDTLWKFGKGIYFTDMSSKSTKYCYPNKQLPFGLLLLCEVALGDCNELEEPDSEANNLPDGKHSTKGLGWTIPDPSNSVTLDGVTVPMGPERKREVDKIKSYLIPFNEYVVYDPAQVRMKYLLRIRFNYLKRRRS